MSSVGGLSHEFLKLVEISQKEQVSLRQILEGVAHRGHSLVIFVLSLPFLFPIPLPGLSVPLGIIVASSGLAMTLGRPIWIPASWKEKKISGEKLRRIFFKAAQFSTRLERWIKPRGRLFLNQSWVLRLNGILIVIAALLLALPLPPGTNFPPALTILLTTLGTLEEDSFLVGLGYLAFAANLALFAAIFFFGADAVNYLFSALSRS